MTQLFQTATQSEVNIIFYEEEEEVIPGVH